MDAWKNAYSHIETVVGGGFWALRKTKNGSKLVKADRGPSPRFFSKSERIPSIGHNDRRQSILNKRNK